MLVERDAKDLAGGVWRARRTRFSSPPVSQSDYPSDLRGHEKLFIDYGIPPTTLNPQKDGTTVYKTPKGDISIHWGKRVIEMPLGHYSPRSPLTTP